MIAGKPGGGKSTLAMNLLARMKAPSLAFLLDTQELTAAARFAAIVTGHPYLTVKDALANGSQNYRDALKSELSHVQLCFRAPSPEEVAREVKAFDARFGLPPDVILIDNLGNQASMLENEWAASKALTLEYDGLAKEWESAVLVTAHTRNSESDRPAGANDVLGNILQYVRLVLSVGLSDGRLAIAAVKNTEGPSDPRAENPVVLKADPARMQVEEWPMVRTGGWGGGLWTLPEG